METAPGTYRVRERADRAAFGHSRDRSRGNSSCIRSASRCGHRMGTTMRPRRGTRSSACAAATPGRHRRARPRADGRLASGQIGAYAGGRTARSSSRSTAPNRVSCVSAPPWAPARAVAQVRPPALTERVEGAIPCLLAESGSDEVPRAAGWPSPDRSTPIGRRRRCRDGCRRCLGDLRSDRLA